MKTMTISLAQNPAVLYKIDTGSSYGAKFVIQNKMHIISNINTTHTFLESTHTLI